MVQRYSWVLALFLTITSMTHQVVRAETFHIRPPAEPVPRGETRDKPVGVRFTVGLERGDLQGAIDAAGDGDTLIVWPGRYVAQPRTFTEMVCGNCTIHRTPVKATRGFHVYGKRIVILGADRDSTILVTRAGYGVLIENSPSCRIESLTITGGERDPDGMATDAGVVIRGSKADIVNVSIVDNTSRVDTVAVGIGGVMGREGSEILVDGCLIENNGWDGVALYRGSTAVIRDNVIRTGRGAGVGITWDATAVVVRNDISDYWKGIGTFGDSRAVVRNNAVHDNLGWGLVVTGNSWMEAAHNVVARNGNCGFALWSKTARARLLHNIIVENGWREEWVCPRVGVWLNGKQENLEFGYNDVWGNVEGDFRDIENLAGTEGNMSLAPSFRDSLDFTLEDGSPLMDAGDPAFTDNDGSPPDLGLEGGPSAAGR
jgi:hypothetical protein